MFFLSIYIVNQVRLFQSINVIFYISMKILMDERQQNVT